MSTERVAFCEEKIEVLDVNTKVVAGSSDEMFESSKIV